MNAMNTSSSTFTKIVSFSLLSFSLFFTFKYFSSFATPTIQNQQISFFNATKTPLAPPPLPPAAAVAAVVRPVLERTGIINELGIMTDDFVVGEIDEGIIESIVAIANTSDESVERGERKVVKVEKFRICEINMSDYVPCLDDMSEKGKRLDCLVPRPKEYKIHIPWPKSRDEVQLS